MHPYDEVFKQIGELLKILVPLLASYAASRHAGRAYRKAEAVEAACTYPACGHTCEAPVK